MNITLPYNLTLRPYQQNFWKAFVIDNISRSFIIWPRRNGKDLICLNAIIAKALQRVGLYLYVAPYYDQCRKALWEGMDKEGRRFLDYIPPQVIKQTYETKMSVEFINGSILRFGGADKPDSLVGGNPVGLLYTEWSLCKVYSWDILRPVLAENNGWAVFNCTVRGMNHAYTMAQMAQKNPLWFYELLTRDDTGIPTLEAIEEERLAGMPESLIKQEFYNDWLASTEDTFIPLELIKPCTQMHVTPDEVSHMQKIMGVDVAFAVNGDDAAIAKRQGRLLHPVQAYKGRDNMTFASIIDREAREFRPDLIFIDAGRGEGVYSRLWQIDSRYKEIVIPIDFGGTSPDNLYSNMTSLMMGRLKKWLMQVPRPYVPQDEKLIREMSTPMVEYDGMDNKVKQESKKAMKSRGVPSPNLLDAVKLTFAEEDDDNIKPTNVGHYGKLRDELNRLTDEDDYDASAGYNCLDYFNKGDD